MILDTQVNPVVLYDLLNTSSKGFMVFNVAEGENETGENLNCIFANNAATSLTGIETLQGATYKTVFDKTPGPLTGWNASVTNAFQFPFSGNYCMVERSPVKDGHLLCTISAIESGAVHISDNYRQKLWKDAEQVMQFGGWIWEVGQPLMQWTEGMYQLMGYEPDAVKSTELTIDFYKKHIHPDDLDQFSSQIERIESYTDAYIFEYRIVGADGNEKFVYLRGENVADSVSGHTISIATVFNVSMLKQIQSELEQKVSDLNKSNSDLEQFAYVASHDLQEPLRKIVSFGERLDSKARETLNEEQHLYLDRILNATRRMQEMINNLLEFSRVSSASGNYVTTDLNEIMKSTLGDLELTLQQKGAVIELGILPKIEVIPAQISQLFLNLLSNSLKFIRQNVTPEISINAVTIGGAEIARKKLLPEKEYIKIVFKDNGIGFENSSVDKMFTIFQRLRGRSEFEGAGIGLAVCKKVVERHHGTIEAFGVPGEGATFEIVLPGVQN